MATAIGSADFESSNSQHLKRTAGTGAHTDLEGAYPCFMLAHVKLERTSGSSMKFGGVANTSGAWDGYIHGTGGGIKWESYAVNNTSFRAPSSFTDVNTSWHWLVFRATSSTNFQLYVDNTLRSTQSSSLSAPTPMDISLVGAQYGGSGIDEHMDGLLAWFAIYNATVDTALFEELSYNPFAHPDGLIWMPDLLAVGAAPSDYADLSSHNYDPDGGTIPGASAEGPNVYLLGGQ